jgi:hypothetical protein
VPGDFLGVASYGPSIIADNKEEPALWFPDIFVIFVGSPGRPKPKSLIVKFFFGKGFCKFFKNDFGLGFANPMGVWKICQIIAERR